MAARLADVLYSVNDLRRRAFATTDAFAAYEDITAALNILARVAGDKPKDPELRELLKTLHDQHSWLRDYLMGRLPLPGGWLQQPDDYWERSRRPVH